MLPKQDKNYAQEDKIYITISDKIRQLTEIKGSEQRPLDERKICTCTGRGKDKIQIINYELREIPIHRRKFQLTQQESKMITALNLLRRTRI